MDIVEFTESVVKQRNIGLLSEAIGIDAWNDTRGTIRDVATALARNDKDALMEAMRPDYVEYMEGYAEDRGIYLDGMDAGEYMDSAEAASMSIDRDNAKTYNDQISMDF